MGFTPKRKVYVLDFEGTDLDGLTARTRSASIGTMLDIGNAIDGAGDVPTVEVLAGLPEREQLSKIAEFMKKIGDAVDQFAAVLVSWDLEDEHGHPVPAGVGGLLTLEPGELMLLIGAWRKAVADVPAPLPETSSGGTPSLEGSLPMDPLSPSLAS